MILKWSRHFYKLISSVILTSSSSWRAKISQDRLRILLVFLARMILTATPIIWIVFLPTLTLLHFIITLPATTNNSILWTDLIFSIIWYIHNHRATWGLSFLCHKPSDQLDMMKLKKMNDLVKY